MFKRPANVSMAFALAIIGGLVSIAFLAVAIINVDPATGTYTQAALAMLIAVLFFGFAGQLYNNGTASYIGTIAIGLINVIVIAVTIITDVENNLLFGIALFVLAVISVLLALPYNTEKWINYDRT